jgi:hypothetical protein
MVDFEKLLKQEQLKEKNNMANNTRNVKKSVTTEDKTEQSRIPVNTPEKKDDYQVIGWIEPVMNSQKVENTKVLRVKIMTGEKDAKGFDVYLSGIVLISTMEKFMACEVEAVPIKTKQQEEN